MKWCIQRDLDGPRRQVISLPVALVVMAVGLPMCKPRVRERIPEDAPRRYAHAVCTAQARCGCLGETEQTMEGCVALHEKAFRRVASWPDMDFDAECFEQVLEGVSEDQCRGPLDWESIPCLTFTGGRARGQECTPEWSASWYEDGHPGLLTEGECRDGACYGSKCGSHVVTTVGIGAPCQLELGVRCEQGAHCAPDGVCHERVGPGDECETPRACHSNYYCAGLGARGNVSGTCVPKLGEGDACPTDAVEPCAELGYCSSEGVCRSWWPQVCFYSGAVPRDAFLAADWIPHRADR